MTENQKISPPKDAPLAPLFHTILAAENKTSELFVKSFQYQGENIATKHLGQIFGFFEIPDTHEDSAYIVNFLASVVKKEYFVNPKRSATDSFEAALHKINLALAELVRQGNTAWLGNLHGVVAVMENNTFHFSVTGDAAILLYRENQATIISEGLADKDAALHPLKTFLEISSGVLLPEDKILVTSPELLELCESDTLRKNAFRMDKNGFARYVRAALVNESPLGVSLIVDLEAAPVPVAPKKKARALREESVEKLQNVFSGSSFKEPKKELQPVATELPEEESVEPEEELLPREYTDKKTGHIYVQGESHLDGYREPSAWQIFVEEYLKPGIVSARLFLKRLTKKSRKNVAKQVGVLGAGSKEIGQNLWKLSKEKGLNLANRSNEALKNRVQSFKNRPPKPSDEFLSPEMPPKTLEETWETIEQEAPVIPSAPVIDTPLPIIETGLPETLEEETPHISKRKRALERFSPNYAWPERASTGATIKANFSDAIKNIASRLQDLPSLLTSLPSKLSRKQKMIAGAVVVIAIVIFIVAKLLNTADTPAEVTGVTSETAAPTTTQTPEVEVAAPLSQLNGEATKLSWDEGNGMLIVTPDDATAIAVTPKGIVASDKTYALPVSGTIESATYMADLKMIFVWSSTKELVSWSVVDKKFTANVFPLPSGTQISNMGTYLTYLYVLDKNAGTIHRFARTEGGFGEPSSWLKTPLTKGSAQGFIVNDTIRIATNTLDQYLRGTKEKTLSETSYQVLGASNNRTFTLGVETGSGKLTVWNADGNQVYDGTHGEFQRITALTYNENTKKLLVTKNQNLIEYSLEW